MYITMYDPLPRHPPVDPRHPRHTEGPAGQARRRAPEVDLEWPASDPKPDRSVDLFIWSILSLSLASSIALRDPFLLLLSSVLVLGLLGLYLLSALQRWAAPTLPCVGPYGPSATGSTPGGSSTGSQGSSCAGGRGCGWASRGGASTRRGGTAGSSGHCGDRLSYGFWKPRMN